MPLLLLAALMTAQRAADIPFGRPQEVIGLYTTGFETSSLNRCWTRFDETASAEFARRRTAIGQPPVSRQTATFRVRVVAARRDAPPGGQGFGHLGGARCEYRVTRVLGVAPTVMD